MSIKSQQSLNEECSEIFERSYSIRSLSEESLSCSDGEQTLAQELLYKMSPPVLSKLRRKFTKRKKNEHFHDIQGKVEDVMSLAAAEEGIIFTNSNNGREKTLWIDEDTFVMTLVHIFGNHKYTTHAHKLFTQLDPFHSGRIWWGELLDRIVEVGRKRSGGREECWQRIDDDQIRIKQLNNCKRETIVKLVNIEEWNTFCMIAVSRGGYVGVYDVNMKLLHQYNVLHIDKGTRARIRNCWLTDVIYMNDVKCLIMCSSDRSLLFLDVATLTHRLLYSITGLPFIPTCLTYEGSTSTLNTSELIFGDERGYITRIIFQQPRVALFFKKDPDKANHYFWSELTSSDHLPYTSISKWTKIHKRSVRRVQTYRRRIMLSCSKDPNASIVFTHINGLLKDYVYKFPRGVTCMSWMPRLHLVACGTGEAVTLMAHSGSTSTNGSVLRSNGKVCDVAILPRLRLVMAYTTNCMVDIWDLYEETHLQTIKVKYPFLGVLGRKLEFGTYSIHPGPPCRNADTADDDDEQKMEYSTEPPLHTDIDYMKWNRSKLYISCNDHICIITLHHNTENDCTLPPPSREVTARRPSIWSSQNMDATVTEDDESERLLSTEIDVIHENNHEQVTSPEVEQTKSPVDVELEQLLQSTDLRGVLEKDFVQMMSHKQDSNQKLAAMSLHFDKMHAKVSMGAPYLSLTLHQPEQFTYNSNMEKEYKRILRLFPHSTSISTTSSVRSQKSSSRKS